MKIGLVLPTDEDIDVGRVPSRYKEARELALRIEAAGFDSLWLYDHFIYRFADKPSQATWEAWTWLSALADATHRVELGTMVANTPFRNPALIAKMAATLDEVSDGRLILGLGAGWHQPEFEAFGVPFDHRLRRFEEALQIICPLLRQGSVDFEGHFSQARHCELLPRGPRPAGPPILVGGTGPRILRLIARYADSWNIGFMHHPAALLPQMVEACAEVGRDPATLEVTQLRIVAYPDLTPLPQGFPDHLTGPADQIAAALHEYQQLGVAHVMLECVPLNATTVQRLSEAVQVYRAAAR
jgi:probable F420-dependent oxidoreductase